MTMTVPVRSTAPAGRNPVALKLRDARGGLHRNNPTF